MLNPPYSDRKIQFLVLNRLGFVKYFGAKKFGAFLSVNQIVFGQCSVSLWPLWPWIYDNGLIRHFLVAGVSGDVGTSFLCLDFRSNNLLRNVCSRHADAKVLSILSSDPSSPPPTTPASGIRTSGWIIERTSSSKQEVSWNQYRQFDVVLITRWKRDAANTPLLFMESSDPSYC